MELDRILVEFLDNGFESRSDVPHLLNFSRVLKGKIS